MENEHFDGAQENLLLANKIKALLDDYRKVSASNFGKPKSKEEVAKADVARTDLEQQLGSLVVQFAGGKKLTEYIEISQRELSKEGYSDEQIAAFLVDIHPELLDDPETCLTRVIEEEKQPKKPLFDGIESPSTSTEEEKGPKTFHFNPFQSK